jgi:hypothetical protein
VLLRSPELADTVQRVGAHLRFNSSLPARLNELAIIINARHWGSKYEWYAHRPLAIKGGLAQSIADDLAQGKRPAGMKADEEVVYDFCTTLTFSAESPPRSKSTTSTGPAHLTAKGRQGLVNSDAVRGALPPARHSR